MRDLHFCVGVDRGGGLRQRGGRWAEVGEGSVEEAELCQRSRSQSSGRPGPVFVPREACNVNSWVLGLPVSSFRH